MSEHHLNMKVVIKKSLFKKSITFFDKNVSKVSRQSIHQQPGQQAFRQHAYWHVMIQTTSSGIICSISCVPGEHVGAVGSSCRCLCSFVNKAALPQSSGRRLTRSTYRSLLVHVQKPIKSWRSRRSSLNARRRFKIIACGVSLQLLCVVCGKQPSRSSQPAFPPRRIGVIQHVDDVAGGKFELVVFLCGEFVECPHLQRGWSLQMETKQWSIPDRHSCSCVSPLLDCFLWLLHFNIS